MRQGPDEAEFRHTLLRIRKGQFTDEDEKLFASRVASIIPDEELQEFVDQATALYAEHADCEKYNNFRLENLGTSIVEIPSKDHRATTSAQPHILRIAVGAKVVSNDI